VETAADGSIKPFDLEELKGYTLKDPTTTSVVPKYKVGDVFYNTEGEAFTILEVDANDTVQYTLEDSKGRTSTVTELDLSKYSLNPPKIKKVDLSNDLGENEDSEKYKQRITQTNGSAFE
jgi:hypothetical protein